MWTGGSNFGRWTGDSITQMYAVDAIVCPDGLPHQPKYDQMTAMHQAIASVASSIAGNDAQLDHAVALGNGASAYVYGEVAFVETGGKAGPVSLHGKTFTLPADASSLVDLADGTVLFSTQTLVTPKDQNARSVSPVGSALHWTQWEEPVVGASVPSGTYPKAAIISGASPVEMTNFTSVLPPSHISPGATSLRSTFAYYEVAIGTDRPKSLSISTFEAMSVSAYIDGVYAGEAHDLSHSNGAAKTLTIALASGAFPSAPAPTAGHTLTIVAEELGYANYGFKTQLKKGIEGTVSVDGVAIAGKWTMRGGLAGEHKQVFTEDGASSVNWVPAASTTPATWYRASFATPSGVAAGNSKLLFNASGLNRGRLWVNGYDVGRYFLLERNDGSYCPKPPPSASCSDYNNSAPYNQSRCDGLESVPEGNGSADACFKACCAAAKPTWQWSAHSTGSYDPGCWCGACSGKNQADPSWTGGHNPAAAAGNCATQTLYHIPASWLKAAGDNVLTIFESGGIGEAAGGALALAGLSEARLATASAPADASHVLNTVISCEF